MLSKYHLKGSLVVKWFLSYTASMLVLILIFYIAYFNVADIARGKKEESNRFMLESIQRELDSILISAEEFNAEISMNSDVQEFLNYKGSYPELLLETNRVRQNLSYIMQMKSSIEQFYIYYPKHGLVISPYGTYEEEMFKTDMVPEFSKAYQENMDGRYFKLSYKDPYGKMQESICRITPLNGMVITSFISQESMASAGESANILSDGCFYIMDRSEHVFYQNNPHVEFKTGYDKLVSKESVESKASDGTRYILTSLKSSVQNWIYVLAVPKSQFNRELVYINTVTIISILLCLSLGIFLAYYLAKRNYVPIKELIGIYEQKTGNKFNQTDEFVYLKNTVSNILKEREEIERNLEKSEDLATNTFFSRFLKGFDEKPELVRQRLGFSSRKYVVVGMKLCGLSHLFDDENITIEQKRTLAFFIIKNIATELLEQNSEVVMTEVDGLLVAIVALKDKGGKEDIIAPLEEANDFILEGFNFSFVVSLSPICEKIEQLPKAYTQMVSLLRDDVTASGGDVLDYDTYKAVYDAEDYPYQSEVEYQFTNYIKVGDFVSAKDICDDVVQNRANSGKMPPRIFKCIIFDMVGTLLKVITEMGLTTEEREPLMTEIDGIFSANDKADIQSRFYKILDNMCALSQKKRSDYEDVVEQITAYVKQNYQNTELCVDAIGRQFHMKPSYLSRVFKENYGSGLLDFIHKVRIDAAKKILQTKRVSIDEVSSMVGYTNLRTFGRAFKKYEGITPGQYKEHFKQ